MSVSTFAGALAALVLGGGQTPAVTEPEPVVAAPTEAWPNWRGPSGTGAADPSADPPVRWSETENVRWKSALPGLGHSTPVVWGERIFVTSALPMGERLEPKPDLAPGAHDNAPVLYRQNFLVLCVDRASGEVLWLREVHDEVPHEGGHATASFASASPVTDGELVIASFGSAGIFGLTIEGEVLWQRDLGQMQSKHGHGEGASPALYAGTVIVNQDHEGRSFVAALEARTGKELWRAERDEVTSWSSPIIAETADGAQAIVAGTERIRGYDLATGAVIWSCGGLSHNVVATPIALDGVLYSGSSYEKQAFVAVRFEGARGDLTDTDRVLWYRRRGAPYVPSPLLYDGTLYFLRHYQGIVFQVDAATGAELQRAKRVADMNDIYGSLVGAAGRLYITDREGRTAVLKLGGGELELLALNPLEDSFSASPVVVGRDLLLRGESFLYCLSAAEDN